MTAAATWTCLRCGSDALVPDVRLIDRDQGSASKRLRAGLATKPRAVVFKGEVVTGTRAAVCGDCGFVEIEVVDPAALWAAHVARVGRELDG